MLIYWIQTALIGFGIILSSSFFMRSSFLKKKNAQRLNEIDKKMETGLIMLSHKIDLVDRRIQEACLELKDLNIRTVIVETRLEERNSTLYVGNTNPPKAIASPRKRGRPPKVAV